MSNLIFPLTAGLSIEKTKTPEWKTITHVATSGKETRTGMMSYPRWNFTISYEFLQQDTLKTELETFIGFYNQLKGGYDTFLFDDTDDNTVSNQIFAVADGTSTAYQLVREMGGFFEPIKNLHSTPTININGSPTLAFTESNGIITFTTPPAIGAVLTWSGTFYFRCRFKSDTLDFKKFMYQFWELKKIDFVSIK